MVKGIIFDKDGTLLDMDGYWLPVARYAYEDILKAIGRTDIPLEELFLATGVSEGNVEISGSLCCGTYAQVGGDIYSVLARHNVDISLQELMISARICRTHLRSITANSQTSLSLTEKP